MPWLKLTVMLLQNCWAVWLSSWGRFRDLETFSIVLILYCWMTTYSATITTYGHTGCRVWEKCYGFFFSWVLIWTTPPEAVCIWLCALLTAKILDNEKVWCSNDSISSLFIYPLPLSSSPSVGGRWLLPLQSLWVSLEEAIHSPRVTQQDWTAWAGQSTYLTLVSYVPLSSVLYSDVLEQRTRSERVLLTAVFTCLAEVA